MIEILNQLNVYKTDYTLKNYGIIKDKGPCLKEDGFYVVPEELLKEIQQCITIGVGTMIDFEEAVNQCYPNIKMSFYDGTIDSLPVQNENFKFYKNNLGQITIGNEKSLDKILVENDIFNKKTLLKIDCEGAEYLSLKYVNEQLLENVEIFILELHWIDKHLLDAVELLKKINENSTLIHSHGIPWSGYLNIDGFIIPNVIELTFINKNKDTNNLGNIFYRPEIDLIEF